jgi:hypothetical protein
MNTSDENINIEPLTADRVQELWSKTYNKEGKPQ